MTYNKAVFPRGMQPFLRFDKLILLRRSYLMEELNCRTSEIAGVSFTLSPMSDDFVEVIESTLSAVNTSKVWLETDDVSTTIRSKLIHLFDVTKANCLHTARSDKHIYFQATYSLGCPGDNEADAYLSSDDTPSNLVQTETTHSFATAKFSLYPLDGGDYMETIYKQIEAMKAYVEVSKAHYSTKLAGN